MEQPKQGIIGYRTLSGQEVELINQAKRAEVAFMQVLGQIRDHVMSLRRCTGQGTVESEDMRIRLDKAEPERWLAIARTDVQRASMAAVRAVAQPQE